MAWTTTERAGNIAAWKRLAADLARVKAEELAARLAIIKHGGFDEGKEEGTETIELDGGYKLKAVKKQNYSLTDKNGETDAALTAIEALGPAEALIASRLVKWSPEISIAEYKKLSDVMLGLINRALTITPGTPSLELIEPKAKT